jgi:short-subunit dehydrogenase
MLAGRGYAVTVVARNESRLDSLLATLSGEGHRKLVADLSTEAGLALVVRDLTGGERYGLLINNAGFGAVGEFAATPLAKTREMIFLNVTTLVDLTHAFLGRAERGDAIIQVSSVLGFLPMPKQPIYSATKAFVASFSESLWFQCRTKGIAVINLCPGSTATNFADRAGWSKSDVPAWATEPPENVAANALRALDRNAGPTVFSGWLNKLSLLLVRLLSRRALITVMGNSRK